MFSHAFLPSKFWDELFYSGTFIINRLPSSLLYDKSSYELLFGHLPNYSFLRVFGCLCYLHIQTYNNHKLEPQSEPCTMGYNPRNDGYKCLSPSGHLYMSRHVLFYETIFFFCYSY